MTSSIVPVRAARQRRKAVEGEWKSQGITVNPWSCRASESLPIPQP